MSTMLRALTAGRFLVSTTTCDSLALKKLAGIRCMASQSVAVSSFVPIGCRQSLICCTWACLTCTTRFAGKESANCNQ